MGNQFAPIIAVTFDGWIAPFPDGISETLKYLWLSINQ
jgi:hypothetical protein